MSLPFPVDHRPYPAPTRPWIMHQVWHDLLFAHWAVPAETMRRLVPACLDLDLFENEAWIGIVPFRMTGIRPRCCPALPSLSAFPELNVRTYVRLQGKPGVFFFSLDATEPLAVRAARWWFKLPYQNARIDIRDTTGPEGISEDGINFDSAGRIDYHSVRTHAGSPPAELLGWYAPTGPVYHARAGSLEHWLTERYCLYAVDARERVLQRVLRGEIHHAPWPLQPARAEFAINTMTQGIGLELPDAPPLLHFARRIDVVVWAPQRLQ